MHVKYIRYTFFLANFNNFKVLFSFYLTVVGRLPTRLLSITLNVNDFINIYTTRPKLKFFFCIMLDIIDI